MKTALLIVNFLVLDPNALTQYKELVAPTLKAHSAISVASGKKEQLVGVSDFTHTSVFRFPNKGEIHNWFKSPAYTVLTTVRDNAMRAEFIIVEEN